MNRRARELQAHATAVQAGARARYVALDERWRIVEPDFVVVRGSVADGDPLARTADTLHHQALDQIERASTALTDVDRLHDPAVLTAVPALEQASAQWLRVDQLIHGTAAVVAQLGAAVADIQARQEWCDSALSTVEQRISDATQAIELARSQDFRVSDLDQAMGRVASGLTRARGDLSAKRLSDAVMALTRVDEDLTWATSAARDRVHRHRDLTAACTEVRDDLLQASGLAQDIAAQMARLRAQFVPSVWQDIAHIPLHAEEWVSRGREAIDRAAADIDLTVQRFEDASTSVAQARAAVEAVNALHASMVTISRDVNAACQEYPRAHESAVNGLSRARQFIAQRPGDVNPALRNGLGDAADALARTERDVSGGRADPHIALRTLRQVEEYANQVLQAAMSDTQRRDAYRSEVAGWIRHAQRQLDRARPLAGMGLTRRSQTARRELGDALRALDEAGAVLHADPTRAHQLANEATTIAVRIQMENGPQRSIG